MRTASRPLPEPRGDTATLRAFVAEARLGTVGRAAQALGRTQPSVSARLASLERAWQVRLFRRVARDTISALEIRQSSNPRAGLPERGSAAERWFNQLRADAEVAEQERRTKEQRARQQDERSGDARSERDRKPGRRSTPEREREKPRHERGGG